MSKSFDDKEIEIDFEIEKETKSTIRYKEIDVKDGSRATIGTIYITKESLPKPFPKKIKVTIEF